MLDSFLDKSWPPRAIGDPLTLLSLCIEALRRHEVGILRVVLNIVLSGLTPGILLRLILSLPVSHTERIEPLRHERLRRQLALRQCECPWNHHVLQVLLCVAFAQLLLFFEGDGLIVLVLPWNALRAVILLFLVLILH